MKEDKEKEAKLEAVKKELNEKIQGIMGPPPEESPPTKNVTEATKKPQAGSAGKPQKASKTPQQEPVKGPPPVIDTQKEKSTQPNSTPEQSDNELKVQEDLPMSTEDKELDSAVDAITAEEGDEVLKAEDEAIQKAFDTTNKPKTLGQKIKNFWRSWWENPRTRWATIIIVSLLIVGLAVFPTTRYFFLNMVGVRSKASLRIIDRSSQQPLKNVTVQLGNQESITDNEGLVYLEKLKLGRQNLVIEKRAFATIDQRITIGWGSNPLGEFSLEPTGIQYAFQVDDFLSEMPIDKAEAISGDASAFSNDAGKILLTLDIKNAENIEVTISKEGYREDILIVGDNSQTIDVKMVPDKKHVFVSKRSGKYDVFKIDADGQNEELVLAGTGSERDDITLASNPAKNVAALVSTRDNIRNSEGYLMSTLTLIDLKTNKTTSLGRSERYEIVGWSGDRLVYVQIAAGASTADPKRHRLMSYDYATGETTELASSNYFNDVLLAGDKVFYAPSAAFADGTNVSLFIVDPDGKNRKSLTDREVWNIFRIDYDTLAISVGQEWYEYKLKEAKLSPIGGAPATQRSRVYVNNPDRKYSIWGDERDGKGVLLAYNVSDNKDNMLTTQSGITTPMTWLNNTTAVYRIHTQQETADYVISVEGGEPRKLVDVTNTAGIDRWYYY